jgi:hypothetical protein
MPISYNARILVGLGLVRENGTAVLFSLRRGFLAAIPKDGGSGGPVV